MASYFDYPLHFDGRGRSAICDWDDYIKDLIRQILLTNPGERVNRPEFGCGLKQLLFMPNSDALAASTQTLVQGALQNWLEPMIQIERVTLTANEESLLTDIAYRSDTGERRRVLFNMSGTM